MNSNKPIDFIELTQIHKTLESIKVLYEIL